MSTASSSTSVSDNSLVIQTRGPTKSYKDVNALRNLDLQVARASILQISVSDEKVAQAQLLRLALADQASIVTEFGRKKHNLEEVFLGIVEGDNSHDNHYDVVTCVGGALNYTFDKEQTAVTEILRVAKPGGIVIIGAVALVNSLMRYLPAIAEEKQQFGIDAKKWLMERGIQDAVHYPVENGNYLHMMRSRDLDALFESQNTQIVGKRAAGVFRWQATMP